MSRPGLVFIKCNGISKAASYKKKLEASSMPAKSAKNSNLCALIFSFLGWLRPTGGSLRRTMNRAGAYLIIRDGGYILARVTGMGRIGPRRNRRSPRTLDATLRSATIFQSAGQVAGPAAGPMGPMPGRIRREPSVSLRGGRFRGRRRADRWRCIRRRQARGSSSARARRAP